MMTAANVGNSSSCPLLGWVEPMNEKLSIDGEAGHERA